MSFRFLAVAGIIVASLQSQMASATIVVSDTFTYADGNLEDFGAWDTHSGTVSPVQVFSGKAVVQHGTGTREDVNNAFTSIVTGIVYYGFDFSVDNEGADFNGAEEWFSHFNTTSNEVGRLWITDPNVTGANSAFQYTVGISTLDAGIDAIWPTDLDYGTTYRAVVGYDIGTDVATLWINPTSIGSTNISGDDEGTGVSVAAFSLRQDNTGPDETIRIDNLIVATNGNGFNEAAAIPEPGAFLFGTLVCGVFGVAAVGRRLLWKSSVPSAV